MSARAGATSEADYAAIWCSGRGGEPQTMPDGTRADCVTESHAIEVDWASKWYEGIGQALWYGFQANKTPGLVLLVRPGEQRFLYRAQSLAGHYGLPVSIWSVDIEIQK